MLKLFYRKERKWGLTDIERNAAGELSARARGEKRQLDDSRAPQATNAELVVQRDNWLMIFDLS